jgi:hypothetical protein
MTRPRSDKKIQNVKMYKAKITEELQKQQDISKRFALIEICRSFFNMNIISTGSMDKEEKQRYHEIRHALIELKEESILIYDEKSCLYSWNREGLNENHNNCVNEPEKNKKRKVRFCPYCGKDFGFLGESIINFRYCFNCGENIELF